MSWFQALTHRERVLLLGGGLLILTLMLWRFAWQPIQQERLALHEDIARYLALAQVADAVAAQGGATTSAASATVPLSQRATRSAELAGITLARLDPEGGRLRVTVEQARFADLLEWIMALETNEAATLQNLEISRLPEPGIVSARLTLENAQ